MEQNGDPRRNGYSNGHDIKMVGLSSLPQTTLQRIIITIEVDPRNLTAEDKQTIADNLALAVHDTILEELEDHLE